MVKWIVLEMVGGEKDEDKKLVDLKYYRGRYNTIRNNYEAQEQSLEDTYRANRCAVEDRNVVSEFDTI